MVAGKTSLGGKTSDDTAMMLQHLLDSWWEFEYVQPPIINDLRGVYEKNDWHDETVYNHTRDIVHAVRRSRDCVLGPRNVFSTIGNIHTPLPKPEGLENDRSTLLELAAWLHDTGKAYTQQVVDGKTKFLGHEEISVRLSLDIVSNLPETEQEIIKDIIGHHGEMHKAITGFEWKQIGCKLAQRSPEVFCLGWIETLQSRLTHKTWRIHSTAEPLFHGT
jgi:hypothetical protein